jgi:Sec-independent protein translocase protein TatA
MRPTIPMGVSELLIVGVIGLLLWGVYRFTRLK